MIRVFSILFATALALAACGTAPEDRAASGAGIGAAGGAILGAITGLTVVEGAALGAVGGALTGVFTDADKFNLGDPPWRRSGSASAKGGKTHASTGGPHGATAARGVGPDVDLVAQIQKGLAQRGYDAGPADGVMGPRTLDAIRKYQKDNALLVDGRASPELAQHISGSI